MAIKDNNNNIVISDQGILSEPPSGDVGNPQLAPNGTYDTIEYGLSTAGGSGLETMTVNVTVTDDGGHPALALAIWNVGDRQDSDDFPRRNIFPFNVDTPFVTVTTDRVQATKGDNIAVAIMASDGSGNYGPPRFLGVRQFDAPEVPVVNSFPTAFSPGASSAEPVETFPLAFSGGDVSGAVDVTYFINYSADGDTGLTRLDEGDTVPASTAGFIFDVEVEATDSLGRVYSTANGDLGFKDDNTGSIAAAPTNTGSAPPVLVEDPGDDSGDIELFVDIHPTEGTPVTMARFTSGTPIEPIFLYSTLDGTNATLPNGTDATGWHQWLPHPDYGTPGDYEFVWIRYNVNGVYASWLDHSTRLGQSENYYFRYALTTTGGLANALFSNLSAAMNLTYTLPGGGEEPQPTPGGNIDVKSLQARPQSEATENNNLGYPGGYGQQQQVSAAQCFSFPDIIYHGQDMGRIWVSTDHGRTRGVPQRVGLTSVHAQGVAVDPYDPKRVLVYAPEDFTDTHGLGGIFFSSDGAQTFDKIANDDGDIGNINHEHMNSVEFCRASVTGTPGVDGYATRAYACAAHATGQASDGTMPFYRINLNASGVSSVANLGNLSKSQLGRINHIDSDPNDIDTLYFATTTGLWKMTNAPAMSGLSRVRTGRYDGPTHISSNGQTLYAGQYETGVYKSTNAGTSWSQVYADSQLNKLFVSPYNANHQGITKIEQRWHKFTQNEWSSVEEPLKDDYERRPMQANNGSITVGYQHCHIFFHTTVGQIMLLACQKSQSQSNTDYRSNNGGASMKISVKGFDGTRINGSFNPQVFDPDNKLRFLIPFLDIGNYYTTNGGFWFNRYDYPQNELGALHGTVSGCVLLPTSAGIGNRIIFGMGRSGKQKLFVHNPTASGGYGSNPTSPIGGDSERLQGTCYNADSPQWVFSGRFRSNNYGADGSWSTMSNLSTNEVVWGCTTHDPGGQAIFALNAGAGADTFKRSTNNGTSWTTVLNTGYRVGNYQGDAIRFHPRDKNIIFTASQDEKSIRRWNLSGGGSTVLDLGLPGSSVFRVGLCAIDPRFPDYMYVTSKTCGSGASFLMTDDGGDTWTNLNNLIPDGQLGFLEVHPLTGNVIIGSANGSFIMRSPYGDAEDLLDEDFVLPDSHVIPAGDYIQDYLDAVL